MGRKLIRTWQHFCLYITGLSVFLVSGCASIVKPGYEPVSIKQHLVDQELSAETRFKVALKENLDMFSVKDSDVGRDEALFNIGLIYAHSDNPDMDYEKSLSYFMLLVQNYPESRLYEQTMIWISTLDNITKLKTKINEMIAADIKLRLSNKLLAKRDFTSFLKENLNILEMKNEDTSKDKALFNIGLVYAHTDNPDKDYKKSILYFRKLTEKYPESILFEQANVWIEVLNIIEKAKQVDIEIEEKKKELAR